MSKKSARGSQRAYKHQTRMAAALDELAEFEKFKEELLPKLRTMVLKGADEQEIYAMAKAFAAARAVTIAMTEQDTGKALSAIKEVLDRSGGKATEKRETTHKYQKLKDEELDSLLLTQAEELAGSDDEDLPN